MNSELISQDWIEEFLLANGYSPLQSELIMLMEWYDRDRDGLISYTEFVDELTPKASVRV